MKLSVAVSCFLFMYTGSRGITLLRKCQALGMTTYGIVARIQYFADRDLLMFTTVRSRCSRADMSNTRPVSEYSLLGLRVAVSATFPFGDADWLPTPF